MRRKAYKLDTPLLVLRRDGLGAALNLGIHTPLQQDTWRPENTLNNAALARAHCPIKIAQLYLAPSEYLLNYMGIKNFVYTTAAPETAGSIRTSHA
jgi:hypothetical protein